MFTGENAKWHVPEFGKEINYSKQFTTGQVRNLLAQNIINLDTPICRAGHILTEYPYEGMKDIRRTRFHPEFAPSDCPVMPNFVVAVFKQGKIRKFLTRDTLKHYAAWGYSLSPKTYILDITYQPYNIDPEMIKDSSVWSDYMDTYCAEDRAEDQRRIEERQMAEAQARIDWELNATFWQKVRAGEGLFGFLYKVGYYVCLSPIILLAAIAGNLDDLRFGSVDNRIARDKWEWMNKNIR